MTIRLNSLRKEFDGVKDAITNIERAATDAGRDLTDAEQADVDKLYERAATIKPEIEAEAAKADSLAAVSDIVAKHSTEAPAVKRAAKVEEAEDMTAGEFLSNALKVQAGMMTQEEHIERAAKYMRASQVTTDTAGIVPTPIVGNLIEFFDASRPVFNSFSSRPMPAAGSSFTRPEITQHVLTGDQAAELDTVTSQKMTITGNTVSKFTEAGYLDLSQQDIDWTDPSAMELVIQDFAKAYAKRMETRACAYLASVTSASVTWNVSSIANAIDTFVDAFAAVDASAEAPADTIWLDPTTWATLAKLTNSTTDESAITLINNALSTYGVSPRWVIGRRFSGTVRVVGSSSLVESYEQTKGLLRIAQPDVLGQRLAYAGYGAFYGSEEGFVDLV